MIQNQIIKMKDIAMHLLDIARNSIDAKARNITVSFFVHNKEGTLFIIIQDDGCGMGKELVKIVTDPFTTTRKSRKVGLGLPFFKMNAEQTGGWLEIKSELNKGTQVKALFNITNIDCVPMGDMAGAVTLLISGNPGVNFKFEFKTQSDQYLIGTQEIQIALEGTDVNQPKVMMLIKEMIEENLKEIGFNFNINHLKS